MLKTKKVINIQLSLIILMLDTSITLLITISVSHPCQIPVSYNCLLQKSDILISYYNPNQSFHLFIKIFSQLFSFQIPPRTLSSYDIRCKRCASLQTKAGEIYY